MLYFFSWWIVPGEKKKATAYFVDIINIILFAIGRDKNQWSGLNLP